MNGDGQTRAHVAYRAVLLAAGLLLFGLLFRQLATLLLAVLVTVIIAIPLAAAAHAARALRVPRPVGALLALLGGVAALALVIYLLIPPFVDQTNEFVDDVPGDRRRPREGVRDVTGPGAERGRRPGPGLRRELHRRPRAADRADHVDRAERGRHPRRAHPDPDHRLLHGGAPRPARGRAREPRAAAAARARPPRARPLRQSWIGWMEGVAIDMLVTGVLLYIGAHDRRARLRDLLRGPVGAARGGAVLRRDRRRDPAGAVRAHRLAGQGAPRAGHLHARPAAREQRDDPGGHVAARAAAPGGDRHRRRGGGPAVRLRGPVRGRADPLADHDRGGGVLGQAGRGARRRARRSEIELPEPSSRSSRRTRRGARGRRRSGQLHDRDHHADQHEHHDQDLHDDPEARQLHRATR